MGPIFHEKIRNYGSDYGNEKITKIGYFFSEKSLNMGTFVGENYPWTLVRVSRCRRHIPDQSKSETPPPTAYPNFNAILEFLRLFASLR